MGFGAKRKNAGNGRITVLVIISYFCSIPPRPGAGASFESYTVVYPGYRIELASIIDSSYYLIETCTSMYDTIINSHVCYDTYTYSLFHTTVVQSTLDLRHNKDTNAHQIVNCTHKTTVASRLVGSGKW